MVCLGAADDLVKPISRDELVSTLQRLHSWQQPRQAKAILATDDDPMALELVDAILSQEGFQISKASGGEEGIAAACRDTPALIILDLLMPELAGFAGSSDCAPILRPRPSRSSASRMSLNRPQTGDEAWSVGSQARTGLERPVAGGRWRFYGAL
jgi:response regulator receiver domain-containing protein